MKAILFRVLSKGLLILFLLALYGLYHYRGMLFPQWFEPQVASTSTTAPSGGDKAPSTEIGKAEGEAPVKDTAPTASKQVEVPVAVDESPTVHAVEPGAADSLSAAVPAPAITPSVDAADTPVPSQFVPTTGGPATAGDVASHVTESDQFRPQASGAEDHDAPVGFLPPGIEKPASVTQDEAAIVSGAPTSETHASVTEGDVVESLPVAQVDDPSVVPATPTTASIPANKETILSVARDAYWNGDYVTAMEAYQQAISLAEDDPAPYGELGNVYFAQKDLPAAADAYSQAAYRLLARGRVEETKHLMLVLKGLDEEKADELHHLIEQYQVQK